MGELDPHHQKLILILFLGKFCLELTLHNHLRLKLCSVLHKFEYLFGEDQGRYIVEISKKNLNKVKEMLTNNSVHFDELGVLKEKERVQVTLTLSEIN